LAEVTFSGVPRGAYEIGTKVTEVGSGQCQSNPIFERVILSFVMDHFTKHDRCLTDGEPSMGRIDAVSFNG
jgi:hypothetical protein